MTPDLKTAVAEVAEAWKESAYYADAEQWTFIFWENGRGFKDMFDRLDLTHVIELACGHGRHSERIVNAAKRITLMDIHEANLEACRRRLGGYPNVDVLSNNGYDYRPLEDASATAVFCYDAMVHFNPDVVSSYLRDTARVLAPGGMGLFHHSNHDGGAKHYGMNLHARNRMSMETFQEYAKAAGLEVVESKKMEWGGIDELDGLTLVRKL